MSNEERAAVMNQQETVALLAAHQNITRQYSQLGQQYEMLAQKYEELQQQMDWFKRQLFGTKSERRVLPADCRQLTLGEMLGDDAETTAAATVEVPAHQRRRTTEHADEGDLRFDDTVPVERIVLEAEIPKDQQDQYEQIGQKTTRKLAQRPGSYVVLEYIRPVYKLKEAGDAIASEIVCATPPATVLDRSFADVSLLAGILVDKFLYHRVPRKPTSKKN